MFKKGDEVQCIDADRNSYISNGSVYKVLEDEVEGYISIELSESKSKVYKTRRFQLYGKPKEKQTEETYDLKISSPYLINYGRMYDEVMVNGTRVAKVTIKIEGVGTQYVLLIHEDILCKAKFQIGGRRILDDLKEFGIEQGVISRTMTIHEWATAYDMVKALVKLPLKKELKRDTIVTVKPLEV